MSRIVDLTLTLKPGRRGVEIAPKCTVAEHGWNASTLTLYSHAGTHMDAPVHYEAGDLTIDRMPLEQCLGPAWIVDLSGIAAKALIRVEDLGPVIESFKPGDSLLLRTGWSRFVDEARYRDELPRVSIELARWCVKHRVRILGVEPPAVADPHNRGEITEVHQVLLGGGVVIVEGLTNLEAVRQDQVFFVALPLKPERGDGCPVRALAIEGIPAHGWLNDLEPQTTDPVRP